MEQMDAEILKKELKIFGAALRKSDDKTEKLFELAKTLILPYFPTSQDFIYHKADILKAIYSGFCSEDEKSMFEESEKIKGQQGLTPDEESIKLKRRALKKRILRNCDKLHVVCYGFDEPKTPTMEAAVSKAATPDVTNLSPICNAYDFVPEEIRAEFAAVPNPNFDKHHLNLPFNGLIVAYSEAQ